MSYSVTAAARTMFKSRLDTLEQLLRKAAAAYGNDAALLERRIAADMLPLGTQVAFTCNQPRNFALWCAGRPQDNLDPNVLTLERAYSCIDATRVLLADARCDDAQLTQTIRLDLGPGLYAELPGAAYLNDFLIPNFYFHLVTAYDILRMSGLQIGKSDYMQHLMPYVRQAGVSVA